MFPETHWFKSARIYHILIDRFAGFSSARHWDKPKFIGGNLCGIINKLDYLCNLGVNTIWLSPFYQSSDYHGYHITDFNQVDPNFGTTRDLKNLIDLARNKNIKIIADLVPNHCSSQHPWFLDAKFNKDSEYKNWFYFKDWPDDYLSFLHFKNLPKINLENQETADALINTASQWAKVGLKGYRIDHVLGVPNAFLQKLNKVLKVIDPEFVLIGEAWGAGLKYQDLKSLRLPSKYKKWKEGFSQENLQSTYIGILDGILDFTARDIILSGVKENKSSGLIAKELQNHFKAYPEDFYMTIFLDNHDLNRVFFELGNSKKKIIKAINLLKELNQPQIFYYATEKLMSQNKAIDGKTPYSDLMAREAMRWDWPTKNDLFKSTI